MNFTRLFDILPYQSSKYPQQKALVGKKEDGTWYNYGAQNAIAEANQLSLGLINSGIKKGDTVAIFFKENSPEWVVCDLAILQTGAVSIPLYPNLSDRELLYILEFAEVKTLFTDKAELFFKIKELTTKNNLDLALFCLEKHESLNSIEELKNSGQNIDPQKLEQSKFAVDPKDLATIIFTSGTTGTPKGVMLSHHNIVSNVKAVLTIIPLEHTNKTLSFLPLAHVFERTVTFTYMATGTSIHFVNDLGRLKNFFQEVKPHYFTTVPRLLEKVYETVEDNSDELTGYKKKVYDWAMNIATNYKLDQQQNAAYKVKLKLARKLVFNQLLDAFGGNLKGIVVGAAPLKVDLARIFTAAGIPIREGYGLTECSPVLSFNRFEPGGTRLGTVGLPIPGVQIKLTDEGEILAKGPNVMMGYFKQDQLTKITIDKEGWLYTGDIGHFSENRFLTITDRKKNLFKTSGGKYLAPLHIENVYTSSPFIDQALVIGDKRKFASILIVPNFENLTRHFSSKNFTQASLNLIIEEPEVIEFYDSIKTSLNQNFSKHEQIKKVIILHESFTVENQLLTPTLKLKRKAIETHFAEEIEELYD